MMKRSSSHWSNGRVVNGRASIVKRSMVKRSSINDEMVNGQGLIIKCLSVNGHGGNNPPKHGIINMYESGSNQDREKAIKLSTPANQFKTRMLGRPANACVAPM